MSRRMQVRADTHSVEHGMASIITFVLLSATGRQTCRHVWELLDVLLPLDNALLQGKI